MHVSPASIAKMKLVRLLAALAAVAACTSPAFADTTLSPSGLIQPLVGGSSNTWGATINTNFSLMNGMFTTGPALSVTYGGTGATTLAGVRTALDLPVLSGTNTWPLAQTFSAAPTFSVAPVFTNASGTRTALGLGTAATQTIGTSGVTVPLLSTANTWADTQTIKAIVAGDAGVLTASAAVITAETSGLTYAAQYRNAVNSANYVLRTDHARTDGCALLITYQLSTTVGSICQNGTATSYNTTSDYRLKTNVMPMASALDRLERLRPIRFNWKANLKGPKVDGFLAHEVAPAVPEAVHGVKDAINSDGTINPQQIDYSKIVPLLVGSVQELSAKVKVLEANDNRPSRTRHRHAG